MFLIKIPEADSTNRQILEFAAEREAPFALMAYTQTAGRGQRGNKWEAEPGRNITLSVLFHPRTVKASEQFIISQAVSVAIAETLRHYMPQYSSSVAIKWPNDIYVGNSKICGILIENVINGTEIVRSIAGIGLNVNQSVFLSDAPNPVSMRQLTGKEYDIDVLAQYLCNVIERFAKAFFVPNHYPRLRGRYFSMLWRAQGYHSYLDTASGEKFQGMISNIDASGYITLTDDNGRQRRYAFKEVEAVNIDEP